MDRAILFVDGFNVYHAIISNASLKPYRWLDYQRLGAHLVSEEQSLEDVFYFTSVLPLEGPRKRHELFNCAQKEQGVKVILGQFRNRDRYCEKCGQTTPSHEEKQTDVGIAIELFRQAMHDRYDSALILSADSDLIPAIEAVKQEFPDKNMRVIFPSGKTGTKGLKKVADSWSFLNVNHLRENQLPDPVQVGRGRLHKPKEW